MWYVEVETVSGADMAVQPKNNEISPMERPRSPVHWGICVMNDMITIVTEPSKASAQASQLEKYASQLTESQAAEWGGQAAPRSQPSMTILLSPA